MLINYSCWLKCSKINIFKDVHNVANAALTQPDVQFLTYGVYIQYIEPDYPKLLNN